MSNTRITPNSQAVKVDVVGSSTFGRYQKVSPSRTYNMYITNSADGDWLVSFPGYQRWLDISGGLEGRALYNSTKGNVLIIVIDNIVYFLSLPLQFAGEIGTLNTSTGEVFIAENLNQQICIVDGVNAYIASYTVTDNVFTWSFAVATDSGGQPLTTGALVPNYVEYHNTYFLFGNGNPGPNGSQWFVYSAGSGTTITYTQTLALQTKSDFALAVKRIPGHGNNVLVMGETVSEIWTQIAGTQIYARNPSINIDYGCTSVATIAEADNYIVWLAQNQSESPVIMIYDGANATRISSDGIDYLLSQIVHPEESTAMLYRIDGHLFYQLTFFNQQDNLTLVYDFNTQKFFNLTDHVLNYHPARNIVYYNQTQYFVSLNNGVIYQIDSNITWIYEGLDQPPPVNPTPDQVFDLQLIRITPSIREANSTRFIANSLALTLEQGQDPNYMGPSKIDYLITEDIFPNPDSPILTELGLYIVEEDSADLVNNVPFVMYQPRIDLAVSKDSGITWSSYVSRGLHPLAYRKNILHWESMGVANDLAFKFRFWGTSRFVVNQALVDIIS